MQTNLPSGILVALDLTIAQVAASDQLNALYTDQLRFLVDELHNLYS